MPWFRVDDRFAMHPKIIATPSAALGLWVRAGSWCAGHLTDGCLPAAMLAPLGGRRRDAEALVKAGLWEPVDGGYRFVDWEDWQMTKSQVNAEREATRKRVAEFRDRKRNAAGNAVTPTVSNAVSNGAGNSAHTKPFHTNKDPRGTGGIEPDPVGEPDPAGPTEQMVAEWIKWLGDGKRPPTKVVTQVGKQIADLLADGIPYRDVKRGLIQWQTRGNLGPAVLPSIVHEVRTRPAGVNGDRRQAATTDLFERALQRAQDPDQQKAIGS